MYIILRMGNFSYKGVSSFEGNGVYLYYFKFDWKKSYF